MLIGLFARKNISLIAQFYISKYYLISFSGTGGSLTASFYIRVQLYFSRGVGRKRDISTSFDRSNVEVRTKLRRRQFI